MDSWPLPPSAQYWNRLSVYNVIALRSLAIVARSDLACLILRYADPDRRMVYGHGLVSLIFSSPEHTELRCILVTLSTNNGRHVYNPSEAGRRL